MTARPASWYSRAACRGQTARMFPETAAEIPEALALCKACFVQPECREYALVHRIEEGVWGGLDTGGLRRARRARSNA